MLPTDDIPYEGLRFTRCAPDIVKEEFWQISRWLDIFGFFAREGMQAPFTYDHPPDWGALGTEVDL